MSQLEPVQMRPDYGIEYRYSCTGTRVVGYTVRYRKDGRLQRRYFGYRAHGSVEAARAAADEFRDSMLNPRDRKRSKAGRCYDLGRHLGITHTRRYRKRTGDRSATLLITYRPPAHVSMRRTMHAVGGEQSLSTVLYTLYAQRKIDADIEIPSHAEMMRMIAVVHRYVDDVETATGHRFNAARDSGNLFK